MNRRILMPLIGAIVIPIFGLGVRLVWVQLGTSGGGSYTSSPDGLMEASASSTNSPKFWSLNFGDNVEQVWRVDYDIVNVESGDLLFEATYFSPGDCRGGDVTWKVVEKEKVDSELKDVRSIETLSEPKKPIVRTRKIYTVNFDCGPKLTLQSSPSADWFVCTAC